MTLEKYEINELRAICEYLDSKDSDVSALGYSLFMANYADKLRTYIREPIE